MAQQALLSMKQIDKWFGGVHAVSHVDFEVRAGEVHALIGENGAGKSTLMRILCGAVLPDEGEIVFDGRRLNIRGPKDAEDAGIAMIHQELSLCPNMSVAENIFLGSEPMGPLRIVKWSRLRSEAEALMERLDTPVDVTRPAEEFGIATQQMVEVAKVLSRQAKLIVMDEPTSALTDAEAGKLFEIIRALKAEGVAIVYISHKMEEIYELADRVTVMRDSHWIGTADAGELEPGQLIEWMVGRKIETLFPKRKVELGAELLRVEDAVLPAADGTDRLLVDHASLTLRAGEILGLGGLRGAGNSELLGLLFGQYPHAQVEATVRGEAVTIGRPSHALAKGLALLTNDRKTTGLVLSMSVLHNMTLASLRRMGPPPLVLPGEEVRAARPLRERLSVKTASLEIEVSSLSGGNQQKVALAKWLMTEPDILLLDEPTRGIDVGAKAEIYELMNELAGQGKGILLITSELPELVEMSDRVLVFHRGRITEELRGQEMTQQNVMAAAMSEVSTHA
jgi:ABC-type sugar transport system ATPase subunit